MNEIVIVGGGEHATVIVSILKKMDKYNIVGYTDIVKKGSILGINYIGDDGILETLRNKYESCSAVIGIGITALSHIDKRIFIQEKLESLGYDLPVIVSPHAVINENVELGKGTVVFDNAVIITGTKVGENTIINTNSTIDHDCRIGNHVHIAPGVTLSGGVAVGNKSFIGAGATLIHNISIGENCIIGAGAVVTEDCLKPGTYVGVPARLIE
jgi:sugar O-acyltransferase (sialic acid O-acetyltransferase NeuD family)